MLYGGSVKANNVAALMAQPHVDGCLGGGGSPVVGGVAGVARFYDPPAPLPGDGACSREGFGSL